MKIEVTCPLCQKEGEIEEALLNEVQPCPHCNQQVTPVTTDLKYIRSKTNYPELRSAISAIHILGIIVFGLWGIIELFNGLSSGNIAGVVLIAFTVGWWKLYKPCASLLVDIADACITISRK